MTRSFGLAAPLSLHASDGLLGCWSRNPTGGSSRFVRLQPLQAVLLLQFSSGPLSPGDAAAAAGIDYDENVDGLIAEFVLHGFLVEGLAQQDAPLHRFHHPELGEDPRICVVEPDVLDPEAVDLLLRGISQSDLVLGNPLSGEFAGTMGFGLKFRTEARRHVCDWLPWIRPFLDRALEDPLRGPDDPGAEQARVVNACYVNALVIPAGAGTGLHVDCTIDGRTPAARVSVLYLRTVEPPGGRLHLQKGPWPVAVVSPRPGMMVHFRGDLTHGVSETLASDPVRISLVCEQYALGPEALKRCAYVEVIRSLP